MCAFSLAFVMFSYVWLLYKYHKKQTLFNAPILGLT